MEDNEDGIDTIVRYAGREITQTILEVANKELAENKHLDPVEIESLKRTVECCQAWLE